MLAPTVLFLNCGFLMSFNSLRQVSLLNSSLKRLYLYMVGPRALEKACQTMYLKLGNEVNLYIIMEKKYLND